MRANENEGDVKRKKKLEELFHSNSKNNNKKTWSKQNNRKRNQKLEPLEKLIDIESEIRTEIVSIDKPSEPASPRTLRNENYETKLINLNEVRWRVRVDERYGRQGMRVLVRIKRERK